VTGRLCGKTAIVFGAGQKPGATEGNGRAIARMLAFHGAKVGCADSDFDRAQETASLLGDGAVPIECDITRRDTCVGAVNMLVGHWGKVDISTNNVGIGGGGDAPAHLLITALISP
jgi:NAD(P)-dependent dehydrogenase (short-subunit alcohol dehydrogenase family)